MISDIEYGTCQGREGDRQATGDPGGPGSVCVDVCGVVCLCVCVKIIKQGICVFLRVPRRYFLHAEDQRLATIPTAPPLLSWSLPVNICCLEGHLKTLHLFHC